MSSIGYDRLDVRPESCIVLHPRLRGLDQRRSPEASLEEARGLALAIGLNVCHTEWFKVHRPNSSTFFGVGTVERVVARIISLRIDNDVSVVAVDTELTPGQQRNLERALECKVIDRTGLILEIFGARARTREGRLQVELAALSYQRSRLVRSWTHLERQRGGAGFMGGPGERQIELDRRIIGQRIDRIIRDLNAVKRTRTLHRRTRRKAPHPIVALVGYTNSGKSTLFNYLTEANVEAKDQLFATLDPTMRAVRLPSGQQVILSDTVGFISNLPHELVEAFHATLEEVMQADLVLHVRDISHPDTEAQKMDVWSVLGEIGMSHEQLRKMVQVLNKIDLVDRQDLSVICRQTERSNDTSSLLSAISGEGIQTLLDICDAKLSSGFEIIQIDLPVEDSATLAWLYRNGHVLERSDDGKAISVRVRLAPAKVGQFEKRRVSR